MALQYSLKPEMVIAPAVLLLFTIISVCVCVCLSFKMEFKVIFKFSVKHCIMQILNIDAKITIKCLKNGFMNAQKTLSTIIKLSSPRDPGIV